MGIELDYKKSIKEKVKKLSLRTTNQISLKKLARHLDMQYTYLSRILNSKDEHLKEDVLFEALNYLEFSPMMIELYMNVRILKGSTSSLRREQAEKAIATIQAQQFSEVEEKGKMEAQLIAETEYMVDPYATIVLASLSIKKYKKDPRLLINLLNLKLDELIVVLDKIESAGFIERGEDKFSIKKLISPRLYFRHDHQLMRLHQQQLKILSLGYLPKISENRKRSFMATFAADDKAFEQIKEEFKKFLDKSQKISNAAQAKKTYQMSFDLFDWL